MPIKIEYSRSEAPRSSFHSRTAVSLILVRILSYSRKGYQFAGSVIAFPAAPTGTCPCGSMRLALSTGNLHVYDCFTNCPHATRDDPYSPKLEIVVQRHGGAWSWALCDDLLYPASPDMLAMFQLVSGVFQMVETALLTGVLHKGHVCGK
jgi:hypothetical protein